MRRKNPRGYDDYRIGNKTILERVSPEDFDEYKPEEGYERMLKRLDDIDNQIENTDIQIQKLEQRKSDLIDRSQEIESLIKEVSKKWNLVDEDAWID